MLKNSNGSLEVICGSMFSGKSEELIKRLRRFIFAQKNVQIFKHSFDVRKSLTYINSHSGDKICAIPVLNGEAIEEFLLEETEVVGIDEIQFFDKEIILFIDKLINKGIKVIVSGLDLDFRGIPFGPVPYLMALADTVVKLRAVCMKSGEDAHFSQRLINGNPAMHTDPLIVIGAENKYEARSRNAFQIDHIPLKEYLDNAIL